LSVHRRLRGLLALPAMLTAVGAVVLAASGLHCAHADESSRFEVDAGDPSADAEAGPAPGDFGEASAPVPDDIECAEETKQIYVLGTDKALYRFYPDTLKFLRIGTVACPTVAGTFSMAIDRRGVAWVEFTDGRLYAVDTYNATCKPTGFRPGQSGFTTFGMGYARNGDSSNGETLYIAGAGLASLDTKTFDIAFLGSLSFGRTELTGLDTQLYAFSIGSGVIAGLNKATGATESVYRTSATDSSAAFAFAQWGGDFWLFTGTGRSTVTRYSPIEDKSEVLVADTGMLIVGAGSSTCAPTKRPN
jgi:hypothetical protein